MGVVNARKIIVLGRAGLLTGAEADAFANRCGVEVVRFARELPDINGIEADVIVCGEMIDPAVRAWFWEWQRAMRLSESRLGQIKDMRDLLRWLAQ